MAAHLVSSFLLRAPLLPVRALDRAGRALLAHPLGAEALALASPDLAAALERGRPDAKAVSALDRYGRRAAFRPTPHGLLAGVTMGRLGARTQLATGGARGQLRPSWGRLAGLGRALLDDPSIRQGVRVRTAPSLLCAAGSATWLALAEVTSDDDDGEGLVVRQAEVDESLRAVLDAAAVSTPWPALRAVLAAGEDEQSELDEYLLVLVDQGLLQCDLCPPLVGAPPLAFVGARLEALAAVSPAAAEARDRLAAANPAAGVAVADLESCLDALPGGDRAAGAAIDATLLLECARPAVLSRAAVARAAALAPLLFRLQEAMTPPAAERALDRALLERLHGIVEIFGAGALDLAALATGGYGDGLALVDEEPPPGGAPARALLEALVGVLTEAARARQEVVDLDPRVLSALLPRGEPSEPPPTFELILTPAAARGRGEPPGTGWMLGLHAPAGASWGRFAHALGAPATAALAELARAEADARPGAGAADLTFAPSSALADLCVHPRVRDRALALLDWPQGTASALCVRDLELVVDEARFALRARDGAALSPSPLHRVRSTTAPAGLYRLLAGWAFVRQHAPWAFSWGVLGGLSRLPRVCLDGFVVAPASWRLPTAAGLRGRGLARWRKEGAVPRFVQVGHEDELLLVDLDRPGAARELARHADDRAFEVWPPLDALADEGGRRVEAVVAVVAGPEPGWPGEEHETAEEAVRRAGPVPPPARRPPAAGFLTHKLFGPADRQDDVLLGAVAPLVSAARAAGVIDRWWFLRYVEGPGQRDHLRLRIRAPSDPAAAAFAARLRDTLAAPRAAGDIVAQETAEYFPETARYGGPAPLALVERLFELDSELALRLLALERDAADPVPRTMALVGAFDALLRGLGLDLEARRALARGRRAAVERRWDGTERRAALDGEFRRWKRPLAALLAGTGADALTAALGEHATRVQSAGASAEVVAAMPAVLHVNAVRLLGPHPDEEAAAYVFWERTLEGLSARRKRGR